jgi:gluconate 5-dehydrogenase
MSVRELLRLDGRVALVTGGSRGLGLQVASALGEMGARLVISARKADELEAARASLAAEGVDALPLVCDLARPEAVGPMVEAALGRHGQIDILVNNAGATWGAPAEEHPLEAWQKLVNLNLTAAFLVAQSVGRLSMIPRRYGRIVNMASIAGLRGNLPEKLRSIAYNTTKGGLVNFTRALAAEWGQYGITVNAIAPGFFPTKMSHVTLERIAGEVIAATPLRRLGGDEDLKGLAVLLASDAARHITGQVIAVDGGASVI